ADRRRILAVRQTRRRLRDAGFPHGGFDQLLHGGWGRARLTGLAPPALLDPLDGVEGLGIALPAPDDDLGGRGLNPVVECQDAGELLRIDPLVAWAPLAAHQEDRGELRLLDRQRAAGDDE